MSLGIGPESRQPSDGTCLGFVGGRFLRLRRLDPSGQILGNGEGFTDDREQGGMADNFPFHDVLAASGHGKKSRKAKEPAQDRKVRGTGSFRLSTFDFSYLTLAMNATALSPVCERMFTIA